MYKVVEPPLDDFADDCAALWLDTADENEFEGLDNPTASVLDTWVDNRSTEDDTRSRGPAELEICDV